MARRLGRQAWRPAASCPAEIADAARRLFDMWVAQIERRRSTAGGGCATLQFTQRRGRLLVSYLLGLYGRPKLTEADLEAAIRSYAADKWHYDKRAWRTFTDWLGDEDCVERWAGVGRSARRAAETRRRAALSAAARAAEDERAAAARAAAVDAEVARLRAEAAGWRRLVEDVWAGIPEAARRIIQAQARGLHRELADTPFMAAHLRAAVAARLFP